MKDILCINIHAFSVTYIYGQVNMKEHILKVHFSGMRKVGLYFPPLCGEEEGAFFYSQSGYYLLLCQPL
jgi:hypothetical protein